MVDFYMITSCIKDTAFTALDIVDILLLSLYTVFKEKSLVVHKDYAWTNVFIIVMFITLYLYFLFVYTLFILP